MTVHNVDKTTVVASDCKKADSFWARFLGLIGRKSLGDGCGLLIEPCSSIHMFFMRFAIDAVFLDKSGVVVYIAAGIKPWRVSRLVRQARSVLELPAGAARSTSTEVGDRLEIA